jgi:hypothetical protein
MMRQVRWRSLIGLCLGLTLVFCLFLGLGLSRAHAAEPKKVIVYPKKTEIDFEGLKIEGELKNPGEFYFMHRPEEKFDSLVKRRKNFHKEMLRDVVMSR